MNYSNNIYSSNNNDWNFMNYSQNMNEPLQEPVAFEGNNSNNDNNEKGHLQHGVNCKQISSLA